MVGEQSECHQTMRCIVKSLARPSDIAKGSRLERQQRRDGPKENQQHTREEKQL